MRTLTRRKFAVLLGAAGPGLLLPSTASAHPYHTTLTQARHNREQGTLECSMRADPDALQAALRRAGEPDLNIDKVASEALDRSCAAYLRKRFILCDRKPQRLPLALVGHELDLKFAWLHFHFPVGKVASLAGFHLEVQAFFEIAPAQVNRVQLEHGGHKETHLFRADHPSQIIAT